MSYGLKKQISKLNPKMGYFGGPNKALANPCFKRPKLVSFREKKKNVKEKEKRRGREGGDQANQGMETEFMYGFYEIKYEFPCFDA